MTPKIIEEKLKKFVLLIRYGTKEKILISIGVILFALSGSVSWINEKNFEIPTELVQLISKSLIILAGGCFTWVFYLFFKLALPKPSIERELPSAIKGLLAFTQEDGELYRKLGRDQEISTLQNYVKDPQIPLVVIMGESGTGKSSLLRAGLSYIAHVTDITYIYWEALPHNTGNGLLRAINNVLTTSYCDLNELLHLTQKAVIVLDQFEQLLPENPIHTPIFDLLQNISTAQAPHSITWFIAFRREYSATWCDFERARNLRPPMLSLKLFSISQAKNVFITLAEAAGLSLEQDLVNGFLSSVATEQLVSPVEIAMGLQMLNELSQINQKSQLSLQDYNFAGGSQGLFVSFIHNAITQRFPSPQEQETLFKVLLECIDLNRNQRIAEGRSLDQLFQSISNFPVDHLHYALEYFASGQIRILEKLSVKPERYRLPHESMIPALRQLSGKILSEVAETDINLQNAFSAWQNSHHNPRYLLTGKDLKKVWQFEYQLDLRNYNEFIKISKKKHQNKKAILLVICIATLLFSILTYRSYIEERHHSMLINSGLPDELVSYSGQLKSLSIYNKHVQNFEWLSSFNRLDNLTLDVGESKISHEAFQGLSQLNMFSVGIKVSNNFYRQLNELKEVKNLTTLVLYHFNSLYYTLQSRDFPELSQFKQIKQLILHNNDKLPNFFNMGVIGELTQLSLLEIDLERSEVSDLSFLKKLKQLTTLKLYLTKSKVNDLSVLKELTQITHLKLGLHDSEISNLNVLQELKKLSSLTLSLSNSNFKCLKDLQNLNKLTSLKLWVFPHPENPNPFKFTNDPIQRSELIPLSELKQLTSLELDLSYIDPTDLNLFNQLNQIQSLTLHLGNSKLNDLSGLKDFKQLTSLSLEIGNSNISNLSFLAEIKNIKTLSLDMRNSAINDLNILKELKQLSSLKLILVKSNKINLKVLSELHKLDSLNLSVDNLNDDDIEKLKSINTHKLVLNLSEPEISNFKDLHNLTELGLGTIRWTLLPD